MQLPSHFTSVLTHTDASSPCWVNFFFLNNFLSILSLFRQFSFTLTLASSFVALAWQLDSRHQGGTDSVHTDWNHGRNWEKSDKNSNTWKVLQSIQMRVLLPTKCNRMLPNSYFFQGFVLHELSMLKQDEHVKLCELVCYHVDLKECQ